MTFLTSEVLNGVLEADELTVLLLLETLLPNTVERRTMVCIMACRQLFLPYFLKTVVTIYFVYFHSNNENNLKWSQLRGNYCVSEKYSMFFFHESFCFNELSYLSKMFK